MITDLASLLVIADGAFPSGAFAHSFGLETAIDEGRVADEAGLRVWLQSYLSDALATFDGAALLLALGAGGVPCDDTTLAELDRVLAAATFAPEQRLAQRRIALALADAFATIGLGATLAPYAAAIASDRAFGHPALAYARAFAALGVSPHDAFVAYATTTTGALASVAARAVPLGQRAVARVRWSLRPAIADAFASARGVASSAAVRAQAYACEVDAMRHARLGGRMFAS